MPSIEELTRLADAAWELAAWAAGIYWDGHQNTPEWLEGLEARIDRVQLRHAQAGLTPPLRGMAVAPRNPPGCQPMLTDEQIVRIVDEIHTAADRPVADAVPPSPTAKSWPRSSTSVAVPAPTMPWSPNSVAATG